MAAAIVGNPLLPVPANHSGGLPSGVAMAGGALLSLSSTLSIFGDIGIILGFLCDHSTRRHPAVRLIFFLACADLLGEMPVIGSMSLPGPPVHEWGHQWCVVQATGNWYAVLSTWLWTMAYAHHCAASISRVSVFFRAVPEWVYHVLCWGVPAISIALLNAYDQLGLSDDGSQQCTIHNASVAMAFCSLLWVALAYNACVFLYVHRAMRAVLRVNSASTGVTLLADGDDRVGGAAAQAEAATAMQRRLDALGGRFVLYILTFIVSQAPSVLRHILIYIFGQGIIWAAMPFWITLTLLSDFLCPLHGFLNFLIYGASRVSRDEGGGICEGCCGGGGGGGSCCGSVVGCLCCTSCCRGGGGNCVDGYGGVSGSGGDGGATTGLSTSGAPAGSGMLWWRASTMCKRAMWWRRRWRTRSHTETTMDSEDSHQSCTAPLVSSEAPSQGRGTPSRGSPARPGPARASPARSSPARTSSSGGGGARQAAI